jgi:molybdopterin molybdotransferase
MAQLSDDCFAFGGELLGVDAALALIAERIVPVVEVESAPLAAASGRILAQDLVAAIDVPPHANSAVDGYALAYADLLPDRDTVLPVGGRAAAGHPLGRPLRPGEAIRIFTGAPMPDGADTVMMQEDCVLDGGHVRLKPGLKKGANRRHAGEDIATGTVALAGGRRLRPADLGLAAALGCERLPVFRPLRVALLSTGDEVREPGAPLPPGAIYDANRVMLAALLRGLGCEVGDLGISADRAAALADTLAAAASHDLIVTSGGVSTGDEDHVRAAIERLGRLDFWRLAIKPGRPVALGHVRGVPLIGLPGNPVAAALTFAILARPLILRLAGATPAPPPTFPVAAGFSYRKRPGRREYLRARLERDAGGATVAQKFARDGAGILSSIVQSDGFAVLGESVSDLEPGMTIEFLPFSEVFGS